MHRLKMEDKKDKPDDICPPGGMTTQEYRVRAKEMVDFIADYLENIRSQRVFPDVQPGYMQQLLPDTAPNRPEPWSQIIADVDRAIMPGITHWQSPSMHAYFPALNSFPSLIGDMLADAINCIGFTWASSPACTELETIVMDWLGKMIGLPPMYLHGDNTSKGMGGGCIQTTASDCTFVTLLAARADAIKSYKNFSPELDDSEINGRLIGYCSDQAHSSVEKAGLIGLVKMRFLPSDDQLSLRGDTLQEAVTRDRDNGLIPFYVCATLGTTGACVFDNLKEIGLVCQSENLWLHVDAAYAGSAFICPEYRKFMTGIEYTNSFAFNPSKWLMVHFDCSAMWVKDARALHRTFNVEPLYLQHENSGAAIDYMGVDHAIHFENLVRSDRRFEMPVKRHLGMVVFRIDGPNELTENLLKRLNKQGRIHMVPASLKGVYVIRFTVTSQFTKKEDIERHWQIIAEMATLILSETRTSNQQESIFENDEDVDDFDDNENQASQNGRDGAPNGFHQPLLGQVQKSSLDISGKNAGKKLRILKEDNNVLVKGQSGIDKGNAAAASSSVKAMHVKTAASKRRDFGISLLLSNVPMSPKIVNGSFAALFDDATASIDLDRLCRRLTVGSEYIRLSPRKRSMLGNSDRPMSLDYGVLSASQKLNPTRMKLMGSLDSKIDDILELGSSSEKDARKGGREVKEASEGNRSQAAAVNDDDDDDDDDKDDVVVTKEHNKLAGTNGNGTDSCDNKPEFELHVSGEEVYDKKHVKFIVEPMSVKMATPPVDKSVSTEQSLTPEVSGYCRHCGRGADVNNKGGK